jgi:hypothetical protein
MHASVLAAEAQGGRTVGRKGTRKMVAECPIRNVKFEMIFEGE